jgi:hypothetical protein
VVAAWRPSRSAITATVDREIQHQPDVGMLIAEYLDESPVPSGIKGDRLRHPDEAERRRRSWPVFPAGNVRMSLERV